jgi:serine/threonine protein kinase
MSELLVTKKLASGSAVDAYLAKSDGDTVLVQVSHAELTADPDLYAHFLDSTRRTTAERRHPAILAPETVRRHPDGRFTLVSGPASGRTAADALRASGPIAPSEVRRWAVRLCDALEFLHAHGVVHGHLSPANIFLDGDERRPEVRLLDTALLLFRGRRSVQRGVLVPAEYLAPERCAGRRASPASDVYGFGVLLHELLTGRPPFSGATPALTRTMHLHAPLPPFEGPAEAWGPVLRTCLAKQPEARFRGFGAVRDALLALAAEETPALDLEISVELPPPLPAALGPGSLLGDYRLEALLGEGGMGQVFSARRPDGHRVAIKVLRPEFARQQAAVDRFIAEARAVTTLHHPNVIDVEAHARDGDTVFFVMEYLEGTTLKAAVKDAAFPLRRVVRLARQAASALAAAHRVGVVHRDVKPDNLMLVRDAAGVEQLKVVDFGVARILLDGRVSAGQTRTGQVLGTPLWMAPEQALGDPVDARADVYALCLVLYTLLARRFPYDGANLSSVVMKRLLQEALPLGERTAQGEPIPPRLRALVARGLRRDANERQASMEEVDAELAVVEAQLSLPSAFTRW